MHCPSFGDARSVVLDGWTECYVTLRYNTCLTPRDREWHRETNCHSSRRPKRHATSTQRRGCTDANSWNHVRIRGCPPERASDFSADALAVEAGSQGSGGLSLSEPADPLHSSGSGNHPGVCEPPRTG